MTLPIYIADRLYIPDGVISENVLKKAYTLRFYNESTCKQCPLLQYRHSSDCESCGAFTEAVQAYSRTAIDGSDYFAIPVGELLNKKRRVNIPESLLASAIDKRKSPKMQSKLKFTGKLFDYQQNPTDEWVDIGGGVLKAAPRSGKTVMAIYAVTKLKLKTIILASQIDWLQQFMTEFNNNTNHKELNIDNKPVVGLVKKLQDLKRVDVALVTYQTFLSKSGQKLLAKIRNEFGVLLIDEQHKSNAFRYSQVISKFNARHKFGITATEMRKDGKHEIAKLLIGQVTSEVKTESLKPKLIFYITNLKPARNYIDWMAMISWLTHNRERNMMIVKQACKDLDAGHSIVIPTDRVSHCHALAKAINVVYDKRIAAAFTAGVKDREKLLNDARSGRIRVVVGIRKMVQIGINVPRWSAIYEIMPISNEPNHYQEIMRVSTPFDGKPEPIVRHFIDDIKIEKSCLNTCMKVYNAHCKVNGVAYRNLSAIHNYGKHTTVAAKLSHRSLLGSF